MQFLRTVFWVVLAVLGVIFAFRNSTIVTVALWGQFVVDTPLWMVALIAFLVGLVPMLVLHRATRWTMKRRLDSVTRSYADPPSTAATTTPEVAPPGAMPIVPPPGVA